MFDALDHAAHHAMLRSSWRGGWPITA
jgi:hypothetical protein